MRQIVAGPIGFEHRDPIPGPHTHRCIGFALAELPALARRFLRGNFCIVGRRFKSLGATLRSDERFRGRTGATKPRHQTPLCRGQFSRVKFARDPRGCKKCDAVTGHQFTVEAPGDDDVPGLAPARNLSLRAQFDEFLGQHVPLETPVDARCLGACQPTFK